MTIAQPEENEVSSLPVEFFKSNHGKAYQVALDKFEKPLLTVTSTVNDEQLSVFHPGVNPSVTILEGTV